MYAISKNMRNKLKVYDVHLLKGEEKVFMGFFYFLKNAKEYISKMNK